MHVFIISVKINNNKKNSMKLISMNRIGPVLRCKWYAIFINMQIGGQICKLIFINIDFPFLLIISIQNEQLKCPYP